MIRIPVAVFMEALLIAGFSPFWGGCAPQNAPVRGAPRFHDLLHTFGTRIAALGSRWTLDESIGRRDIETT